MNRRFVLLRGLTREARHWGAFTGILQQSFPQAEILTPDIPGSGRLCRQTSPGTVAGLTNGVREQLSNRRQLELIALSMGGMVAIDWMIRYPAEIRSAVLINSSARSLSPFYKRLRWQTYPEILRMLFHSKQQREKDILALTSNRKQNDSGLVAQWTAWQRECPVSGRSAKNQLLAAARFRLPAKPAQPVLILTSKGDRLVHYCCSHQLQKTWSATLHEHETAGHDLPLDEPDWVVTTINQWTGNA